MVEIKLFKDYNLSGYTLIEGFPSAGLVGPMAVSYMIDKLKPEYIGYIASQRFPPIAAIHNAIPMHPARLYKYDKLKIILVMAEFVIPADAVSDVAMELISFCKKNKINQVFSISGMAMKKPKDNIYLIGPQEMLKKAASNSIKPIAEGAVAGVNAILLINAQQYGIKAANVLVEVDPAITDPKYAELAIEGLQKLMPLDIDLDELDKEAKLVEAKIRDMLKNVKESHEQYNNTAESTSGPSMYA
ncbi:MAG: PAC2 family protein [Candidatus Marsarchaeota archaeon]|nr:PAC2 family protein [Candidatus Marsarchaeota archaeon]